MDKRILVLGASGQIGTELTQKLRELYGNSNVVASDIKLGTFEMMDAGPFEIIDATDKETILSVIKKYQINQVYLLAAMLSATAEKFPQKAWNLNMNSLLAVLELAKEKHIQQVYWPSSIAVFGPTTPKIIRLKKPLWNLLQCMESANWQANFGVIIITKNLVLTCEVCVIQASFLGKQNQEEAPQIMLLTSILKRLKKKNSPVF